MGACDIDLRDARIASGEAVWTCCPLGWVEVKVPENWRVGERRHAVMGRIEDKTRRPAGRRVADAQSPRTGDQGLRDHWAAIEVNN